MEKQIVCGTNLVLKRCVSSWPAHILFFCITDERSLVYRFQVEYHTTTRFRCHDATIRAGYARSNVSTTWVNQAGSRRTRLGFLFRFFPCRVHALPSTREKDRQTEKRRETNAGYTRRRHLQKVEKQERKRAVFCTIVKSTDGREIDNTASQPRTCVGRNDPRARVHEALSRFIRRLARLRRTASRGMSLSTVTDATIYRDNSLRLSPSVQPATTVIFIL